MAEVPSGFREASPYTSFLQKTAGKSKIVVKERRHRLLRLLLWSTQILLLLCEKSWSSSMGFFHQPCLEFSLTSLRFGPIPTINFPWGRTHKQVHLSILSEKFKLWIVSPGIVNTATTLGVHRLTWRRKIVAKPPQIPKDIVLSALLTIFTHALSPLPCFPPYYITPLI